PAHGHLTGVLAVFFASGVAVAAAIALQGDARRATVIAAAVAALAGVVLGWALRSHLRRTGGPSSRNGWWLLLAVVLGGLLIATPNGVQLVTVSLLAGFLVACSILVARDQLEVRRRSSV